MISITQKARDVVFRVGIALFLVAAALLYWAFQRFDDLPNYQRLAVFVPMASSFAMLHIDQYRNWDSVKGRERGYAIAALVVPPMLLLASLIWFVAAPGVRG